MTGRQFWGKNLKHWSKHLTTDSQAYVGTWKLKKKNKSTTAGILTFLGQVSSAIKNGLAFPHECLSEFPHIRYSSNMLNKIKGGVTKMRIFVQFDNQSCYIRCFIFCLLFWPGL